MQDLKFVYIYPLSTLLNISLVLDLSNKFCSIIFISLASEKKKQNQNLHAPHGNTDRNVPILFLMQITCSSLLVKTEVTAGKPLRSSTSSSAVDEVGFVFQIKKSDYIRSALM